MHVRVLLVLGGLVLLRHNVELGIILEYFLLLFKLDSGSLDAGIVHVWLLHGRLVWIDDVSYLDGDRILEDRVLRWIAIDDNRHIHLVISSHHVKIFDWRGYLAVDVHHLGTLKSVQISCLLFHCK